MSVLDDYNETEQTTDSSEKQGKPKGCPKGFTEKNLPKHPHDCFLKPETYEYCSKFHLCRLCDLAMSKGGRGK